MYSVVLLMAVTTGGEAPEARGCRGGCRASSGGCYVSCGGGGCARPARRAKGCKSTCGGCYSYSGCYSYGGYSACHAYSAPATYSGCHTYSAPMVTYPGCTGGTVVPSTDKDKKAIEPGKNETTARITVTVPEGATVKIDGESTASTSPIRTFESPVLAKGKTYSYTFVAEYQQSGRPVTVEKKVSFQAGSEVQLDLTKAGTAVASK